MKYISTFALVFLVSLSIKTLGQIGLYESLKGEWTKEEIKLKDGSTLFNPEVTEGQFILHFVSLDTFLVTYNGRTAKHRVQLADSTIIYRGSKLKITKLEKPILEVTEVDVQKGYKPLKMKFVYKPVYDLSYIPESYIARNKEEVFIRIPNTLEPKFINGNMTAMDFIYNEFRFPEYRKGGFVARFIISKDGQLTGARMIASSNNRYDQKLIEAILKTQGKWYPAEYNGVKVNCEVELNFDLGYSSSNTVYEEDKKSYEAEQSMDYANYYFGIKNYKSAIFYYSETIKNNPYSIDAYYKRAASYIFRKDLVNACRDYRTLSILNQVRAEELFTEYCSEIELDKKE